MNRDARDAVGRDIYLGKQLLALANIIQGFIKDHEERLKVLEKQKEDDSFERGTESW